MLRKVLLCTTFLVPTLIALLIKATLPPLPLPEGAILTGNEAKSRIAAMGFLDDAERAMRELGWKPSDQIIVKATGRMDPSTLTRSWQRRLVDFVSQPVHAQDVSSWVGSGETHLWGYDVGNDGVAALWVSQWSYEYNDGIGYPIYIDISDNVWGNIRMIDAPWNVGGEFGLPYGAIEDAFVDCVGGGCLGGGFGGLAGCAFFGIAWGPCIGSICLTAIGGCGVISAIQWARSRNPCRQHNPPQC